jgi:hypothetical protein
MKDGTPEKKQLDDALAQARQWLANEVAVGEGGSDHHRALKLFEQYLASVEAAVAPAGIRAASHTLRWHIADSLDWSAPHCAAISEFSRRIDSIGRSMEWADYKAGPDYRPLIR